MFTRTLEKVETDLRKSGGGPHRYLLRRWRVGGTRRMAGVALRPYPQTGGRSTAPKLDRRPSRCRGQPPRTGVAQPQQTRSTAGVGGPMGNCGSTPALVPRQLPHRPAPPQRSRVTAIPHCSRCRSGIAYRSPRHRSGRFRLQSAVCTNQSSRRRGVQKTSIAIIDSTCVQGRRQTVGPRFFSDRRFQGSDLGRWVGEVRVEFVCSPLEDSRVW